MASQFSGEICKSCDMLYFEIIEKVYKKDMAAIKLLCEHGVLLMSCKCLKCDRNLRYYEKERMWRCTGSKKNPMTKKRDKCGYKISDNSGTFLGQVRIPAWKVVLFAHSWLKKFYSVQLIKNNLNLSDTTIVDFRSFCSEVTDFWLDYNLEPIGGPGIVVELDETVCVKRKYNRGRVLKEIWIIGAIERISKKCFVKVLLEEINLAEITRDQRLTRLRRDKDTLIPIIQQYIKPGSIINSDGWGAYVDLGNLGYEHNVVIHERHFVNPDDPNIHTQTIERLWRDLKEWVSRSGMRPKFMHQYLSRWLFLRHRSHERCLHDFLIEMGKLYVHKKTSAS